MGDRWRFVFGVQGAEICGETLILVEGGDRAVNLGWFEFFFSLSYSIN